MRVLISQTTPVIVSHDLGYRDAKGRAVGVNVSRRVAEFRDAVEGETANRCGVFHNDASRFVGLNFLVEVRMTKNGEIWGPSQNYKAFTCDAAAAAHIEKTLAARRAKGAKA